MFMKTSYCFATLNQVLDLFYILKTKYTSVRAQIIFEGHKTLEKTFGDMQQLQNVALNETNQRLT